MREEKFGWHAAIILMFLAFGLPLQSGDGPPAPAPRITSFEIDTNGVATLEYDIIGNPFTRVQRTIDLEVDDEDVDWRGFSTSTQSLGPERLQSTFSIRTAGDRRVFRATYE